jgi:hypothetical protein
MSGHWTYESFDAQGDLGQGDVLEPSDELRSVLSQVHPHFLDDKYVGFVLVTQSCDLVRRHGGNCGIRYLNIVVVRELEGVLHDLLGQVCKAVSKGVYTRESKGEARRLLERLFNQNEQALGLFYLHPDADVGIGAPAVALLRVGVALKAQHYEVCLRARRGRLTTEFRAKLGWLVGNLYSRIGTQDWSCPSDRAQELRRLTKLALDGTGQDSKPVWVPEAHVLALGKGVDPTSLNTHALLEALKTHAPPPLKMQAINRVKEVLKDLMPGLLDTDVERLAKRLENDALFSKLLRDAPGD